MLKTRGKFGPWIYLPEDGAAAPIETLTLIRQNTCRYHQENRNFDQRLVLKRMTYENEFPAFLNSIYDVTAEAELQ